MTPMARRRNHYNHCGSEMSCRFGEECPFRRVCPGTLITVSMEQITPQKVTHILLDSPTSQAELYRQCSPSSNDFFQYVPILSSCMSRVRWQQLRGYHAPWPVCELEGFLFHRDYQYISISERKANGTIRVVATYWPGYFRFNVTPAVVE